MSIPSGVPASDTATLAARLEASRRELLDLGLRNPLLNFRLPKAQGVAVVQEDAASVFDVLVRQGKTMYFQAAPEAPKRSAPLRKEQPTAAADDLPAMTDYLVDNPPLLPTETERLALLTDNKLQTAEPLAKLESRLQKTYYTARTSLEETGANILYLALGMLTWYEAAAPTEPRQAPLVLVPVLLERSTAAERYKLRHTGGEVAGNLSLQAKLKASFGLALPLPELDEDGQLADYYATVAAAVAARPGWQVERDSLALSFFSFGKFLLYRDLDPATWPAGASLLDHPAIAALLGTDTGFRDAPPTVDETAFLDTDSPAAELHQVLDADSSQLLALLAVHEGRNLVIQGPPGTGKSQTIANLLAEAIGAGKKVLFVAEKMAALEVVKRRLDALGLGAACLELHSNKANKKALHDELRQTLRLGRPAASASVADQVAQLPRYRQVLNDYALAVNAPLGRSRRTAQQLAGELLRLQEECGPVALPRIPFSQLAAWTDADAAHAEDLATRLQASLQKIGPPRSLLFWGSELTVLLPADHDELTHLLHAAPAAVQALLAAAEALAHYLGLPAPASRLAAEALLPAARHAQLAPPLAGANAPDAAWLAQAGRLTEALQAGAAYQALRQQYDADLLPEAWAQSLLPERAALLAYGEKWWKFIIGDYRRARQRLQGVWRGQLPQQVASLVKGIDAIHEAARHAHTVAEAGPLGQQLFGPAWQGLRSDWPALLKIQQYLTLTHQRITLGELPAALLGYLARAPQPAAIAAPLAALENTLDQQRTAVQAVAEALHLNEARRFGPEGRLQFQPFAGQLATLAAWAAGLPALRLATEWNNVAAATRAENLPELLVVAETWPEASQHLARAVRQTWLEYLQRLAYTQHPALRQFERASHEEVATRFRQADSDSLYHNRIRAMRCHFDNLPNSQAGGQMLVLRNEFAKKSRHLPLRQLMERAGRAVQAIKPVFMMSPLSVASYLPPGAVEFDLVVFDEASQVKPVDALGAVARGRQLVVVGDSKQLPPTSFFDSLTGLDEAAEEENVTADIQSILELCKARQMPERMLRWHYRSRHESLIAASNRLFYHDNLVVFPSAGGPEPLGLVYHHLPATYYERGTTRTNPQEAAAVAEAVLAHARTTPWLTLGVVAFSSAQRQAIQDALDGLRRQQPEAEAFFGRHAHEPFFIKNLENVQGDERDVMLISLGYGRTKDGTVTLNFGPLGREGGARRLNVLITRAKQRCEVFTNLTGEDLDVARLADKNPQTGGIAALQVFLQFAQASRLPPASGEASPASESPFEEAVGRALTARGYVVRSQVGSAGFHVDLAIVDPADPGRYVLGIACDGAMYHRARSARDRDRLRQSVLEHMGWHLHRIWSADWFHDPAAATERAVAAIEEARRLGALSPPAEPATASTAAALAREEPPAPGATSAAAPYQLAQLPPAIRQRELHLHPAGRLAAWVAEVVAVESPVHLDEVTRRLATATGAAQVGSRIRASVAEAAQLAGKIGSIRVQDDFCWTPSMPASAAPVRDRSALPPVSRKMNFVAPEELAAAIFTIVRDGFALERAAVALPAARLLGFARPSEEQRQLLEEEIDKLLLNKTLIENNGVLTPG
jgi:very-short-patch-repair endonuclease